MNLRESNGPNAANWLAVVILLSCVPATFAQDMRVPEPSAPVRELRFENQQPASGIFASRPVNSPIRQVGFIQQSQAADPSADLTPPFTEIQSPQSQPPATFEPSTEISKPVADGPIIVGEFVAPVCSVRSRPSLLHRWFSIEPMVMWTKGSDLPAMATMSTPGTAPQVAGVIGQPNTSLLYGNDEALDNAGVGLRARAGRWLDSDDGNGFIAEFLWLPIREDKFSTSANGNDILARPFSNLANGGTQDSQLVNYPGLAQGSLAMDVESRLYSIGVHYWTEFFVEELSTCPFCEGRQWHRNRDRQWGFRIGPRFTHLDETFQMHERVTRVQTGSTFELLDSFKTENSFLGGEIGLRMRQRNGDYSLDVGLNLAIGATRQELDIAGFTTTTLPGISTTSQDGAFLAQGTNIGKYDSDRFSIQPSLEVALGVDLQNNWRFNVGYNVLYWTNVLRVTDQIGSGMNPNLLPPVIANVGDPGPIARMQESDYFAHGISIGFEKSW